MLLLLVVFLPLAFEPLVFLSREGMEEVEDGEVCLLDFSSCPSAAVLGGDSPDKNPVHVVGNQSADCEQL